MTDESYIDRYGWVRTRLDESHCTRCGKKLDGASGQGRGPEPGDFTLCIECGAVNVFDDELRLRKPTAEESADALGDDGIKLMREKIRKLNNRLLPH